MKGLRMLQVSMLLIGVTAHGGIYNYTIDGIDYPGHYPWLPEESSQQSIQRRWWPDPIYGVRHPYLACNRGNPLSTKHPKLHARVRAGSNITASYIPPDCPQGVVQPETPSLPGDISPPMRCTGPSYRWVHTSGPLLAYMAACHGSCDLSDAQGKVWFKIYENGLIPEADRQGVAVSSARAWSQADIIWDRGSWDVTIPLNLRPGNYLIRHEIIMVGSGSPIQMYPHCAQLSVVGDGDKLPETGSEYLVEFPGAYSEKDPGIELAEYIYDRDGGHAIFNYTIPGPKLWTGK